jgi:hypothetical protein
MELPTAFTEDNLRQILDSNEHCHDIPTKQFERLVDIAQHRADARGSALDDDSTECMIISGTWSEYAQNEFGFSDNSLNKIAFGELNHQASLGKDAVLFNNTQIVQAGWLESGDGRKSMLKMYEDDDYDGADSGELWIPKSAAEYLCVVKLDSELLYDGVEMQEAM